MKKNIFIIYAFLLLALTGCEKVIDIKETDFIGGDIALKSVANNEQGIIGAYGGINLEMCVLLNSTIADEVRVADFYNATTTHEWQFGPADVGLRDNYTATTPFYRVIDRVNRVLAALPNVVSTSAADDALKLKLRGEALFIRAFCHFELYRFYSNSAVSTDLAMAYMEVPSLNPTARITVGPYIQKLKADLTEAKSLLPNALTDVFRANRLAVSGLQARVSLYLKDYASAITFSTEYISGLGLSPRAQFSGIWTDANKNESAFIIARTTATSRMGSLYRGTSANPSNIGTIT